MKKDQRSIFLFFGLLITSISQIASHFTKIPDFVSGLIMGIGIGALLLAFIRKKENSAC